MKQRLLTLFIVLATTTIGAWAVKDKTVEIGIEQGGTGRTTIMPFYSYRDHHMSEQIYFSDEIGIPQGGLVKSISFYYEHTRPGYERAVSTMLEVYMANTDNTSFEGDYPKTTQSKKWIAGTRVLQSTQVTLPATSGWITIQLQNSFKYDGRNLAILINSNMVNDYQYGAFRKYDSSGYPSIYINYDTEFSRIGSHTDEAFTANAPGKYFGRPTGVKSQIKMVITPNPGFSFSDVVAPEQVMESQPFTMSANVTNIDVDDPTPETTVYVEASADGSTWQTAGQQSLAAIDGGGTAPVVIENTTALTNDPAPENILLRLRIDAFSKSFYSPVKSVPYIATTGIQSIDDTQGMSHDYSTLDGRKLNGAPTRPGIYIVDGKKRIIK